MEKDGWESRRGRGAVMTKWEFWCQLRKLERKYDEKLHSPVRKRLKRIDDWASIIMEGWHPSEDAPTWLCNELKYVEEGRAVGSGEPGTPRELMPEFAELMFHGVLTKPTRPLGNLVLPEGFQLKTIYKE